MGLFDVFVEFAMSVKYESSRCVRICGDPSGSGSTTVRGDGYDHSSEQSSSLAWRQNDEPDVDRQKQDFSCEPGATDDDPPAGFGSRARKLFQIFVASSSHTTILALLLLWIELSFQTFSVGRENVADTVFAFAVVWLATFGCFYLLFEDEEL